MAVTTINNKHYPRKYEGYLYAQTKVIRLYAFKFYFRSIRDKKITLVLSKM